MSEKRVAIRYAKALADLAVEQGKLEEVKKNMDELRQLNRNRDFNRLLKSPVIPNVKKKAAVDALLNDKLDQLSMQFVRLLIDKERAELLPDISIQFSTYYRTLKHISKVLITSAEPMDQAAVDQIVGKLKAGKLVEDNVEVSNEVDPELIGGFIISFGDNIYDASVLNTLKEMKHEFSKNPYRSLFRAR